MKKLVLALTLLAFSVPAFADDQAARLQLARDTIAVMKAEQMFDAMTGQLKQMAVQSIPIPSGTSPEAREKFIKLQEKSMETIMDAAKGMLGKMAEAYAATFTEQELKAMKAFYSTPEGQAMIAKQPQLLAALMPHIQQMQHDLIPKIQKIAEEAKTIQ